MPVKNNTAMHDALTIPNRFDQWLGTTRCRNASTIKRVGLCGRTGLSKRAESRSVTEGRRIRLFTGMRITSRNESCPWCLDGCQRHHVSATEHRADPHGENANLAFPRWNGQHMVTAVHHPGRETGDDDSAILKDSASQPERGHDAQAVMDVFARRLTPRRREAIGGQRLA